MNAQLIITIQGGTAENVSLDELREFAQKATDSFGKGLKATAELRHGNPQMPTVEPVIGNPDARTDSGLPDENRITDFALRAEGIAAAQAGREVAESGALTPTPIEDGGVSAPAANETEREAAKVRAGAATAEDVPGNTPTRDRTAADRTVATGEQPNAETREESDDDSFDGVQFASAAARTAAQEAASRGLTAEHFKRQRKTSNKGFTAADVERIAEAKLGPEDEGADEAE